MDLYVLVALSMQFSFAQEKTVTGVVTDATGGSWCKCYS
jgi:hypothetical protein